MDLLHLWQTLPVLLILAAKSYSLECTTVDRSKCECFAFEDTIINCPKTDGKVPLLINISVTKRHQIKLQCLDPLLDLDIIPNFNVSEAKVFQMEDCYFNSSFGDLLEKFNISNLTVLTFESMTNLPDDENILFSNETLWGLETLESLTLSYSSINLERDFLANVPNLITLTLHKNSLSKLDNYFDSVPKLRIIDLSENQIESLPDDAFSKLSNLTKLLLFSNNITKIDRKSFSGLGNVKLLELSLNHIEELPEDSFADVHNLVNLSLRGNKIKRAYSNLFANNRLIENLRLGNNPGIILEDGLFANLTFLRTVELFQNNLETIPLKTFQNCHNLEDINLQRNLLTSLSDQVFRDVVKLRKLNLSQNKLVSLPDTIFASLERLEELDLSHNQLQTIGVKLFRNLDNLQRLDLRKNLISIVELGAFSEMKNSLTYLDLSFNQWNNSYIFDSTPLTSLKKIQQLILNHNKINEIPTLLSALELKKMDLSYNQIEDLSIRDFVRTVRFDMEIDLTNNKIEQVNFDLVEFMLQQNRENYDGESKMVILKISQNPIACDCTNYKLFRYNNNEMSELKTLLQINQDDLKCFNTTTRKVLDIKLQEAYCSVKTGCPVPCSCSYSPFHTAVIANCSFEGLESYPVFNFSVKEYRYKQTFAYLKGNRLTEGPAENIHYANITRLDLSANAISKLNWIPPRLQELDLSDNRFENLDKQCVSKLKNVSTLQHIWLSGNPWECTCKSFDFQKFLMQYYHKVNSSAVFCKNAQMELVKLTDICKISSYLSILLPVLLTVLLLFSIAFAIYYRYQTEIKVYLFAKNMCLWFVSEEELDKDKTYDVFISYAHQDENFVYEQLLPELERKDHTKNPYKVCIHTRDWIPGEYIAEQVVNSVKDSRRTLVVLSNDFMNSVWGKVEFRTAHTESISEGRARVIVVIYGDLDESKLDSELQSYLKTNTYVKWGDKYFWNKLRYALPHSRDNFYERNTKHSRVMLKIDDKFDLIKTPPSPSNTSTPPITLDPSLLNLDTKNLPDDLAKKIDGESPLLIKQVSL